MSIMNNSRHELDSSAGENAYADSHFPSNLHPVTSFRFLDKSDASQLQPLLCIQE